MKEATIDYRKQKCPICKDIGMHTVEYINTEGVVIYREVGECDNCGKHIKLSDEEV